jgi:hypothetical protein
MSVRRAERVTRERRAASARLAPVKRGMVSRGSEKRVVLGADLERRAEK